MATKQTDGTATSDAVGTETGVLPESAGGCESTAVFRAYTPLTAQGAGRYNVEFTIAAPTAGELVKRVRVMTGQMDGAGWTPAYGYVGPNGAPAHVGRSEAPPQLPPAGPQMLATGAMTGPAGEAGGVIDCEWYEISANKGKAVAGFWKTNRNFAEIQIIGQDRIDALLGPIGPTALAVEPYRIPCRVHFTWGKARPPKADGTPANPPRYQDVTMVERIG